MTYNLNALQFTNDFAFIELEDGSFVAFNLIDEELLEGNSEADINVINIALITNEDKQEACANVIGLANTKFIITTAHTEYLGKVLNKDNIQYCTMEVSDD